MASKPYHSTVKVHPTCGSFWGMPSQSPSSAILTVPLLPGGLPVSVSTAWLAEVAVINMAPPRTVAPTAAVTAIDFLTVDSTDTVVPLGSVPAEPGTV